MTSSPRMKRPIIADYLLQQKAIFRILESSGEDSIDVTKWLERSFPIASWGRIDWTGVEGSVCLKWLDDFELSSNLQTILLERHLMGKVVVAWTDAMKMPIEVDVDVLSKHCQPIFDEDWDVWICSLDYGWCIEVYHEGEICFGYSHPSAIAIL
jgi:hypothetical protein